MVEGRCDTEGWEGEPFPFSPRIVGRKEQERNRVVRQASWHVVLAGEDVKGGRGCLSPLPI